MITWGHSGKGQRLQWQTEGMPVGTAGSHILLHTQEAESTLEIAP